MAAKNFGPVLSHVLMLLVAMLNICILSYDAGMINNLNAVEPFGKYFKLNSSLTGLNAAIVSAGSVFGAPVVGPVVDRWGRKAGLGLGSICIIVGVILQGTSKKLVQFVIGRFIVGFATLINGSIAPMWVMELASARYRAILSGTVLVAIPFTSFFVTCIMLGIYDKKGNWAWRGIVLGEAVPSIISLCILPFVDESPRWLLHKGEVQKATEVLARLHANGNDQDPVVVKEIEDITTAIEYERTHDGGWMDLINTRPNLKRFSIAVLTNIFYQVVGGNMILYFSSAIIRAVGITERRDIILINMGLLLWKAFASIGGVFIIDRVGRRKPFIAGTAATIILFALLAVFTHMTEIRPNNKGYAIVALIVVALFLFAVSTSWMIMSYTYPAEVLRYSQRAKGVVLAQSIGYAFSFLNLYTTPLAIESISWKYYVLNGSWNVIILVVVWWLFVETKGKTLEEVDEIFEGMVQTGVGVGSREEYDMIDGESIKKKASRVSA